MIDVAETWRLACRFDLSIVIWNDTAHYRMFNLLHLLLLISISAVA